MAIVKSADIAKIFDGIRDQRDEAIKRAEAAEAALQAVMTRAAQAEAERDGLMRQYKQSGSELLEANLIKFQLEAERDDLKIRMQSWHDSAMTLADQRDAAYKRNDELEAERDEARRQLAEAHVLETAVRGVNDIEIELTACPICNYPPISCECAYVQVRAWLAAHPASRSSRNSTTSGAAITSING